LCDIANYFNNNEIRINNNEIRINNNYYYYNHIILQLQLLQERKREREKERNMDRGIICIEQCSPSQVASMLAQPSVQEKSRQQ
jgi:hypothetical protein